MFRRSIRPPDDIVPNPNDPASVPPSTVGPDQLVVPGDPHGVVEDPDTFNAAPPPRIIPSAWSGWPADWWPPMWSNAGIQALTGTAWMCIDRNSGLLATFPPYLVNARTSLSADWLNNPDPDLYTSWEECARQLFWEFQAVGEAFVLATSRYATGWPARFHVVPPWAVNVEMDAGRRFYSIGQIDVTADMLHIRYQSSTADAHGHGPLEAGQAYVTAASVLNRYSTGLASSGGVPSSILQHPEELSAQQAADLQAQWVNARLSTLGEPAVLSGGVTWQATQLDPQKMALVELQQFNDSKIALLLGVPPALVGLPSGGDSMTYSNVTMFFDQHWRWGLSPMAQMVMAALSGFLLPRGVSIELNVDRYVRPEPLQRAQTYQIMAAIVDPATGQQALSVDEIRAAERLDNSTPTDLSQGVLQ